MAEPALTIAADGGVTAPDTVRSKLELGDSYGMRNASSLGKEWYEQIDALEKYAMGKTAEEFVATPTKAKDEHHTAVPDVEDLASSCTMDIGSFLAAAGKAVANAK